ncbi:phosphatidylserine decarboxylase [Metschnikowia bicuspidata var. bicuspidata NRRL YB-4993]|uniref:Phosphatidylserine decarboxylase proenzyme 1, mitochondrial n=1 Tax=Metschnikowia bicuspidata var. bicuspidata NRRL YB-4993 TaxID=869754 RepID=A0A1A0HHB3_9ASCO|nr:phosphatidylserine decarboxylase [Metschnikowia bicuspidata var. bicuspidata NRRL YB-4993]OBA23391.1 phosphatidylserine decarboxylase [Metschnikowia bicuspidata var. bicuspidata NRRL YB-4993]
MRRKFYPHSPFVNGPQAMNITQPLSRASSVAEVDFQRLFHDSSQTRQRKLWGGYRGGSLPKIPRPKKTAFFYSSWSKSGKNIRLPGIPLSRRGIANAPLSLKSKTKSFHRRFFSDEARRQRKERRRFVRWWTLTSLTVVLGGVASKIMYERDSYDEYDDAEPFSQYTIKPQSWHLYAYSTLPLKTISRLWGQVNSINLPVWLRSPSYKLYSALFGVNLDEMEEPDLTTYPNLSEFFYRKLKTGVRPLADTELVSPSDGKVLKFGVIENGEIEQVKGMTYSIDALLGLSTKRLAAPTHLLKFDHDCTHETVIKRDQEFANLNGISYSLDDIVGGENESTHHKNELKFKDKGDGTAESSKPSFSKNLQVAQNLTPTPLERLSHSNHNNLYFAVIYLAPGDYHRYHSPTNWVTTLRRHFIGELFSVAPFFQKTLQGLFVLNERVALLGYWKYGFFSMIPVGATNVGSIVVNFDKDLKTNDIYEHEVYLRKPSLSNSSHEKTSLLSSSTGDSSLNSTPGPEENDKDLQTKQKRLKKNTVYEATYTGASSLLGGFPLSKGEEVGGFKLGSTVVLVFEAPDNFKFDLEVGQKIKMGETLGNFH